MKTQVQFTCKAAKGQRSPANAINKKQSNKREEEVDEGSHGSKPYCRRRILNPSHPYDRCTVIPTYCIQ